MRAPIASGLRGRCPRRSRRALPTLDPGTILDRRGQGRGLCRARDGRGDERCFGLRDMVLVVVDANQPDRADGDQCNQAREFHGVPTPGIPSESASMALDSEG